MRELAVRRDPADAPIATITWSRVPGASGYVVRDGVAPDGLYASHHVDDVGPRMADALDCRMTYYFTIDAISASGATHGASVREAPAGGDR